MIASLKRINDYEYNVPNIVSFFFKKEPFLGKKEGRLKLFSSSSIDQPKQNLSLICICYFHNNIPNYNETRYEN